MSDWPFTPEAEGGGWQVASGIDQHDGWPFYYLDPAYHDYPTDQQIAADVNLIAAAPRLYRALKAYFSAIDTPWKGENQTAAFDQLREAIEWIDGN